MMKLISALLGGLIIAAASVAAHAQTTTPPDCDAYRCQFQTDITNCVGSTNHHGVVNHGTYVHCVAHAMRDLAKSGALPTNCKGKIVRCAARSTFGKTGFETCTFTPNACDPTTGLCPDGATCTSDADCGTTCHIMRAYPRNATPVPGQDRCTLAGGVAGTGTCCASCP